jgi:hypothetical protein
MDTVFKSESKKILIYISKEVETDPYDKNVSHTVFNAIPINAIISDISGESMKWKTGGIVTSEGKQVICKTINRPLLEMSYKIKAEGQDYQGFKINGRMQIRKLDDNYIQVYIYKEE